MASMRTLRQLVVMGLAHALSALALLLVTSNLAYADTGRRVALVIGNGAYQNAVHLPNPPNDAQAVAEALRGLDFEVIEAVDLDQPDMLSKVDDFSAKLEGADTGLFYYAGHGLQVGGENYLVPIDARLKREAQVRLQTLPLQTVLATMEAAVATRIVLLDACRDNPLAQQLKRSMAASRSSAVGQGLAEVRTALGTLIAYATGPGDVASDGDGAHSPFTDALLDHIATPGLEVRQVLGRVRDEVLKQTGERQVPWDSSSLRGEFYFKSAEQVVAPTPDPSPPPSAASPPSDYGGRDRIAFDAIDESKRARDFAIFLERYPDSALAPFAQSRLDDLTAAEKASEPSPPAPAPSEPKPPIVAVAVPEQEADPAKQSQPPSNQPATPATHAPRPGADPSLAAALPDAAAMEAKLILSREDWRGLQRAITALGFDTRGVDGKPGPATRSALASWQEAKRVEATGYLGPLQRELILAEAKSSDAGHAQAFGRRASPEVQNPAEPTKPAEADMSVPARSQKNPLIVADLPSQTTIVFLNAGGIDVYNSPSMRSRRLGRLFEAVRILAPAANGFVMVDFHGINGFTEQVALAEKRRK